MDIYGAFLLIMCGLEWMVFLSQVEIEVLDRIFYIYVLLKYLLVIWILTDTNEEE